MADVNKNIIDAYRSMYEEKTTPEQCIRDTLKKEGGAAGLAPLDKALKDKGHDMSAKEVISKMSDVKQHRDGDYILEDNTNDKSDDGDGLDKVQPKAVKKKFADRKDKDIDNDGDVDSSDEYLHKRRKAVSKAMSKESQNGFRLAAKKAKDNGDDKFVFAGKQYDVQSVYKESFTLDDIREMCHSKDHDCATYVDHPEFGLGKPVYESHAIPDDDGYVEWYDVEFAHGIEEKVPTENMQVLQTEAHKMNAQKKKKVHDDEEMKEDDVVVNVDADDDSDEVTDKKKKKPMPKKDNGEEEEEEDVVEPKDDGDDVEVKDKEDDKKKKKNGVTGNSGEKKAEISKIGEKTNTKESVEFANLLSELMAVDVKGKKKDDTDGKEPEEYEDIAQNRSKGETDFIDAHGKKDVVVDGEKEAEKTADSQKKNKEGKHVAQQKAKGEKNPIKSTEAPVKDKEVKDGEGKKSVTKESYTTESEMTSMKKNFFNLSGQQFADAAKLAKKHNVKMIKPKRAKNDTEFQGSAKDMKAFSTQLNKITEGKVNFGGIEEKVQRSLVDMARDALAGKVVPEMSGHEKVKEKNPFDARTKDAKAFLERMYKRKHGEK